MFTHSCQELSQHTMISAILKYSIGSLFYGGLITVLMLSLFIFLIKGWYKDAIFKPISYIIIAVLSLIVLFNSTIVCGALAMKSDLESIRILIEEAVAASGIDGNTTVDLAQSDSIFQRVVDEHPILYYYADMCDFSGWRLVELPMVMCDTLNSYLNGIIVKRLLWSLAFVIICAIAVIKSMGRSGGLTSGRTGRTQRHTGRTDKSGSRYGRARRSSRI